MKAPSLTQCCRGSLACARLPWPDSAAVLHIGTVGGFERSDQLCYTGAHTAVPRDAAKQYVKLDETVRWKQCANTWVVQCLRLFAVGILESLGAQPTSA